MINRNCKGGKREREKLGRTEARRENTKESQIRRQKNNVDTARKSE